MFARNDAERKRRLAEIAGFADRSLLSDEEFKFLEENFEMGQESFAADTRDKRAPLQRLPRRLRRQVQNLQSAAQLLL